MSKSTPICQLFCSVCKAESRKNPRHYDRDFPRIYLDVEILAPRENGARCRCKRCGHIWYSKSAAAKRLAFRLQRAIDGT